jgi:hypothetical protein
MPTANDVLTCLRQELVNAGLVRKAGVAGVLPPMHIEPVGGAPAPGERPAPEDDAELVTTIDLSSTLGEAPFDAYRARFIVDVHYRSKGTDGLQRARTLDAAIRNRLVNRPDYGLGWVMGAGAPVPLAGGLLLLSSTLYGGLGPVSRDPGQGAHDLAKYAFEIRA